MYCLLLSTFIDPEFSMFVDSVVEFFVNFAVNSATQYKRGRITFHFLSRLAIYQLMHIQLERIPPICGRHPIFLFVLLNDQQDGR